MKNYPKGIFALVVFALFSCAKDDGVDIEVSNEPNINITLVGEDLERVYQYEYDSSSGLEVQSDLTQELGLGSSYLTLRQKGDVLSFYIFSSGNFSLIQKNVETGQSSINSNFYTENNERNILWGTNDDENIYLGIFEPQGTSNFGVLTIDNANGMQRQLMIEEDIQISYQPIYHQGKLLLTYRDGLDNYKVAVVETATNNVIKRLDFGELVPNIFIDGMDDVVILKSESGENYSYTIYDTNTFEQIEEVEFPLTRYFDPGILTARFIGKELFYYSLYVQPAEVRFGPASFNFTTNSETLVDMERIVRQVEAESGKSIQLLSQGIDEQTGSYLVGYVEVNDNDQLEGGALIISSKGELIKNIELPFVPTYFLIKD
ncbi:hypothetical protein [Maribacter sp. 2307UL18-2]|uniref:hypothetical protein n=1 Tax=Maribacter sp. 2307UL18-2 TaxID=3386274 RepID=UPI0039BCB52D